MADAWIPVEERLPEEGMYVLVAFVSGYRELVGEMEVCEARWWTHPDGQEWEGLHFTGYSGDVELPQDRFWSKVLYWQDLPEPPPYEAGSSLNPLY